MLLFLALVWLIVSFLVLWREPRNFWGGMFIGFGLFIIGIIFFWTILNYISYFGTLGLLLAGFALFLGFPLSILFSIFFLIHNTLAMKTREGRSLVGKLSAGLGLNLSFILFLVVFFILNPWRLPEIITRIGIFVFISDFLILFLFIGYLFYSVIYQFIPIKKNIDYIIVLGAGLNGEKLTPLLKSRVDTALDYQHRQTNPIKFIFSGGKGEDEIISEAEAMGNYARKTGVPSSQIFEENQSKTTLQNMLFSKKIILENYIGSNQPVVLFSTSNYHVLRSAIFAKKAKLKAQGIGAPTAYYFLPSALIREFIALVLFNKLFLFIYIGIIFMLCFFL